MGNELKVAVAEYQTPHNGRERNCVGTIVMRGEDDYLLREHIVLGVDQGRDVFDERTRTMSLAEAKRVLNEWIAFEIAEVVQIPWE
jgi:hypothetical protein